MRAAIVAISALIGITACNREAEKGKKETSEAAAKTEEQARKAGEEIKEGAEKTAEKTKEEADKAAAAVKETGEKTAEKSKEVAHETKEGAEKAGTKTKEEAARAALIAKAVVGGDYGKTEADKKTTQKIREDIKKEKSIPETDKDIAIKTTDGKVMLTGTVASEESKKEIVKIANGVAGKKKVKDEIKLAEKVGTGPGE